ncbi:hypothetical protein, partial [Streptomyces sp. NPDC018833]|uniref:hypothetical protein n=1 Tax=Streptomyces sp. NPDC018833 TaxID=3365053 RepID=UPI0037B72C54
MPGLDRLGREHLESLSLPPGLGSREAIPKLYPNHEADLVGRNASDKVGAAGKGSAKAKNWKAPRKSGRKDLIES